MAHNLELKLISAAEHALFEERLARAVGGLANDDVIVDIKFDTCSGPSGAVTYSALLHVQRTETWS